MLLSFSKTTNIKAYHENLILSVQFQAILDIFLSVRVIELNHLSYEKAHVNAKHNYTGSKK